MLFNSLDFAIFLPIVFALYWAFGRHRTIQNVILLTASYVFYGWWDWRFLILIFISSIVDYIAGIFLEKEDKVLKRKLLLGLSIGVNLGMLCFFKYFNFFADSFISAFSFFGMQLSAPSLNIILPVGISFYTFQALSYTIDIYRKQIPATKSFVNFFAFVSFFPQLVAGPIERAKNLLPQFEVKRVFSYENSIDGMKQILWGLFKKIAVADTLAISVNQVFASPSSFDSTALSLAAIFFAVQIYADFSGYSDIALGTAKLFGFNLMINFHYPFFATSIADFWRRWHISLTTWFRDYIYIPLGGKDAVLLKHLRNILVVFLISGLWHGAAWNFVFWGALHGIVYIFYILLRNKISLPKILGWFLTFGFVVFSMIFFRAESLPAAFGYLKEFFTSGFGIVPVSFLSGIVLVFVMFLFEWFGREKEHPLIFPQFNKAVRFIIYFVIVAITISLISQAGHDFIYFQF